MLLAYLRPLWAYRGFILGSVKREFQSKYRTSMLGSAWAVLNPLAMILVYTIIFAEVMRAKLPGVNSVYGYGIFLCAGTLTWNLFAEIVSRAQSVFLENANLLKKLSFPRLCLPIIIVVSATLNFSIVFGLFIAFLLLSGNFPGVTFLAVVPLVSILVLFSIGLGIVLGVINVFFRDVGLFFGIFLMFWFWLTPIVYPLGILPAEIQVLMAYNPMAPLIMGFQAVFVSRQWPLWASLIYPAALATLLCLLGLRLFRKRAGEMVDEL